MGRRGNPCDNAKAESFIKTLKHEEVHLNGERPAGPVWRSSRSGCYAETGDGREARVV